ncbi:hypothetical protein QTP86_007997 [Hemibagrus guttatus]|nr:hypothetical protein QTP86_007997 [Hemibagrus guttatus]
MWNCKKIKKKKAMPVMDFLYKHYIILFCPLQYYPFCKLSWVGGSIPASAVCVEFACSPRASGVSSGCSGFLPWSKDMH